MVPTPSSATAVRIDRSASPYAQFGVESSLRALLDPRVWLTVVWAVLVALVALVRERRPPPALVPHGGRFGLPADFLIAPDGRVLACKYGAHADDQWSVDELLALAAGAAVAGAARLPASAAAATTRT